MRSAPSASVDPRGFAWPLSALERKREHEADAAAARLASAQRKHAATMFELRNLQSTWVGDLRELTLHPAAPVDPVQRRYVLGHLAASLHTVSVTQADVARSGADVEAARLACGDAQCRLEAARKLREAAWQEYAQHTLRHEARLADAAWLARSGEPEMRG